MYVLYIYIYIAGDLTWQQWLCKKMYFVCRLDMLCRKDSWQPYFTLYQYYQVSTADHGLSHQILFCQIYFQKIRTTFQVLLLDTYWVKVLRVFFCVVVGMWVRPDEIYGVTVMPCYDKKLEASRSDFYSDLYRTRDVDCVITSGN